MPALLTSTPNASNVPQLELTSIVSAATIASRPPNANMSSGSGLRRSQRRQNNGGDSQPRTPSGPQRISLGRGSKPLTKSPLLTVLRSSLNVPTVLNSPPPPTPQPHQSPQIAADENTSPPNPTTTPQRIDAATSVTVDEMLLKSTFEALSYLSEDDHPVAKNFIGGHFVPAGCGEWIDSEEPATGRVWLRVANSNGSDVNMAVAAAKGAFESWSQTSKEERAALLNKVADIVEKNADDFARLESRDQGKTVQMARQIEIPRCVKNFRAFASAILCHTNRSCYQEQPINALNVVKNDPVGVSALICPWNLPLYLLSFKLAPALACGNTVVCKPSEMTSATAYALMYAFVDAGFPPGVVNMVVGTGPRVGEHLCTHPDVDLISFTGSTAIGQRIATLAAPAHKKLSLELGGKNAAVVFDDVDLEEAMGGLIRSCFANQGEICLCTSRLYVQQPLFDRFLKRFVAETKKLKVGDPRDKDTAVGALISKQHWDKVNGYYQIAEADGCTIHCGGPVQLDGHLENGHFFAPTIITGCGEESRLIREEIFGPMVAVIPFETAADAVRLTNSVRYGLSASVWSKSVDQLHWVANRLRVGTVWLNCWLVRELTMPFGGTKQSGTGREGIEDSIHFFTEQKTICLKLGNP